MVEPSRRSGMAFCGHGKETALPPGSGWVSLSAESQGLTGLPWLAPRLPHFVVNKSPESTSFNLPEDNCWNKSLSCLKNKSSASFKRAYSTADFNHYCARGSVYAASCFQSSSAALKKPGLDLEAVTTQRKLFWGFLDAQLKEKRPGEQRPHCPLWIYLPRELHCCWVPQHVPGLAGQCPGILQGRRAPGKMGVWGFLVLLGCCWNTGCVWQEMCCGVSGCATDSDSSQCWVILSDCPVVTPWAPQSSAGQLLLCTMYCFGWSFAGFGWSTGDFCWRVWKGLVWVRRVLAKQELPWSAELSVVLHWASLSSCGSCAGAQGVPCRAGCGLEWPAEVFQPWLRKDLDTLQLLLRLEGSISLGNFVSPVTALSFPWLAS